MYKTSSATPSMQWVLRIWELWLCACYLRKSGTRTSPIRTCLLSSLLPRPGSAILRQHHPLLQPIGFPPAALSEIAVAPFPSGSLPLIPKDDLLGPLSGTFPRRALLHLCEVLLCAPVSRSSHLYGCAMLHLALCSRITSSGIFTYYQGTTCVFNLCFCGL